MKNDFINNMTHEFKTPIATISLALDTLNKVKDDDSKKNIANKFLKTIKEENRRMHYQVEDILNLSRLGQNQKTKMDKQVYEINDLVERAVNHIELVVKDKKGKITLYKDNFKYHIYANEDYFISALVNILDNAVKYSDNVPKITVTIKQKEKYVYIKIQDKGIGMSKRDIKYIFKKFYRVPKGNIHNVKGHGIGLSFVKYVIDWHEGKVKVSSEPNHGTTFVIQIPIFKKSINLNNYYDEQKENFIGRR